MAPVLHSFSNLLGRSVRALNDEFGEVQNVYLSGQTWRVAYFVVQTGGWLEDRRVLIAPAALRTPFWSDGIVWVDLSRQEILDSPPVDAAKPVSRQQEELMNAHFGWPAYWNPSDPAPPEDVSDEGPSELRSLRELMGYSCIGTGSEIGTLCDIIGEEPLWNVPYLVVDTGGLISRKRFVPTRLVENIDWAQKSVQILTSSSRVHDSPDPPSVDFPDAVFRADLENYYAD